jgi:phosphate transport system ATP-binding protein
MVDATQLAVADRITTPVDREVVIDCDIHELYYGRFKAVRDTKIPIQKNAITAFIGPSGCG